MNETTKALNDQWIEACKVMHIINERRKLVYLEWKAEMESDSSVQKQTQKNQNQLQNRNDEINEDKIKFLKPELEKSSLNPKSPDAEYFENIKHHESSGIQSPFSEEYNPASEKYNFDAITSSIDDTTTSISKKTVKFKKLNIQFIF